MKLQLKIVQTSSLSLALCSFDRHKNFIQIGSVQMTNEDVYSNYRFNQKCIPSKAESETGALSLIGIYRVVRVRCHGDPS